MSVDGPLAIQGDAAACGHAGAGRAGAAVHHAHARPARAAAWSRLDVTGTGRIPCAARDGDHRPPGARRHDDRRRPASWRPAPRSQLAPPLDRFVAGTWRATASFGGAVRYDVAGLVQALDDYPLWCLEQATSRGFPLAVLPDGPIAGPDRAGAVAAGGGLRARPPALRRRVRPVVRVGRGGAVAFGLRDRFPAARARPPAPRSRIRRLTDALKFLADAADEPATSRRISPHRPTASMCWRWPGRAGQARRGCWSSRSTELPTPLAKAQLGAALALAHDPPRAEAAFAAALAAPARSWWASITAPRCAIRRRSPCC